MFDQMFKTADTYLGQMKQAFDTLSGEAGKFQAPSAYRDFAARQTQSAKARFVAAEQASLKAAGSFENAAVAAAELGAGFLRRSVEGTVANATMVIEAARDVVAAPSPQDAMRRQTDFLKACGEANMARAREGFAEVQEALANGTRAIQTEAARFADLVAKAA